MSHSIAMPPRRAKPSAFTLIELLVSITFLVILMLVVSQVIGIVQRSWVSANSRVSQFREARRAFDVISRTLSQATLNTYWGNDFEEIDTDAIGKSVKSATSYLRKSELQFVCGPTSQLLESVGGSVSDYPGHAVFFQAPLGVTRRVQATESDTVANTESMVNLLCGRGYFVEWGDDLPFRPPFLSQAPFSQTVPVRNRLRLMEYSPTAEMNSIYSTANRLVADDGTVNTSNTRNWFQDALTSVVQDSETSATVAFTRPIAENILALVISPQLESTSNTPTSIAPNYLYDSLLLGPSVSTENPQGTQHVLPPLLKVTMIALDERSGEQLSSNSTLKNSLLLQVGALFTSAASFAADLDGTDDDPGEVEQLLLENKLNYRIFTTTIALKQSRWSF